MAAECWRMSERQLVQYCRELAQKQDLVFAGELGRAFVGLLCESLDQSVVLDWAKLQKDVRFLLDLIHDGQNEDERYWLGMRNYQQKHLLIFIPDLAGYLSHIWVISWS